MKFLASRKFFYAIVALLALQSLWIALTARYPQAFDEQFHFGLIQLHAQTWLPYFNHQPAGAEAYGAVVRDPSYLYHYLMSFPYRLINVFTHDEVIQVIILRGINIVLLCSALPLFKRIGRRVGLSDGLVHGSLLLFVLIPIVPMLGAQINYYNLLVPLTALLTLLLLKLQAAVQHDQTLPLGIIWSIAMVCLLGSLVHYPFLPLVAVAGIYVLYVVWKYRAKLRRPPANASLIVAILLLVVSFGMFSERYAINFVRYHSPTPECDQVLSVQQCQAYSPWLRNHYFAAMNSHPTVGQTAYYPAIWTGRVIEETVFAIGSGFNTTGIDVSINQYGQVDYWSARSLPVPRFMVLGTSVIGLVAVILAGRKLWANRPLRLVVALSAGLTAILFLLNLSDYLRVGDVVGVHGRYLIPVMPFMIMLIALAFKQVVPTSFKQLQPTFLVIVTLFVIQGGGLVTYVVRSEPRWFWPQSAPAKSLNSSAQKLLKPIVVGSNTSD